MTRNQATSQICKAAGRKDLYISGERGAWYVDSMMTTYIERRVKPCKTLAQLVRNVRESIDANCFER